MAVKKVSDVKWNDCIFLLVARYNGNIEAFTHTYNTLDKERLKAEYNEKKDGIIKELNARYSSGDGSSVPSTDELVKDIYIKLKVAISVESDPSRLARALEILNELKNGNGNDSEEKQAESQSIVAKVAALQGTLSQGNTKKLNTKNK